MTCEKFDLETKNCKEDLKKCPFWNEETKTLNKKLVPEHCSVLAAERVSKENNKEADGNQQAATPEVKL